ncbi:S49 family peptidase [Methylobacterium oryzihabitans]|uniref:S49 family peptidase n=1 Tax=Methylobacterium oryzihabitans TaxID=2499852 RepID=A0A3S2W417_9HYPH|nr:S49 family peptidase [Methylobacterium oryzihabitans]RVU13156.1 S49 family peptidase [Methylobacterium oryzihabitans]
MSNLMAALFPEGRGALVDEGAAGEIAACLSAAMSDPRAPELMSVQGAAEDGFWPAPGHWMTAYRPYVVANGVLQIPVKGVLLANLSLAWGAYATGYVYIRRALERGLADPQVKGIALLCDSPGGEVAGNFDLVDAIFAARGTKPIRAFAHERAYSAAYSIASAADRIVVSRTGGVGSVGVVTSHTDASVALERAGLKVTFIFAGRHKVDGNPTEPLPDAVKARWQARIDELMDVFVATVARNRGMKAEAVRATEALTYTASQSIAAGLADEIGSLADAVAAFAADLNPSSEDETMSTITEADHAAAVASARSAGETAGQAAGAASAKTRIQAILGADEANGRETLAQHFAFQTDLPAEAAVAALGAAPKAAAPGGSGLAADMAREGQPNLGAPPADQSRMSETDKGAAAAKALLGKA